MQYPIQVNLCNCRLVSETLMDGVVMTGGSGCGSFIYGVKWSFPPFYVGTLVDRMVPLFSWPFWAMSG